MVSPLTCCCFGQRTDQHKTALEISYFFESPTVPTLSNLLCHRSQGGKRELILNANAIWPLSCKSGCRIQFWIFKFSTLIMSLFSFYFSSVVCGECYTLYLVRQFSAFPPSPLVQGASFSYTALTFSFLVF